MVYTVVQNRPGKVYKVLASTIEKRLRHEDVAKCRVKTDDDEMGRHGARNAKSKDL